MKPHLGILAWISYLLLQIVAYIYISGPYYMTITGVILLIVYALLLRKKQMLHLSSRDLKGTQLLSCFGIGVGLSLISKIAILFGFLSEKITSEQTAPDPFIFAVSMITTVVLIPVLEELLYRGILFGSFSRSFSYKTAIIFSSVLFLPGHRTLSWPTVFIIGALLAWIYWQTDNLAVTMVIHGTANFGTLLSTPLYNLLTANRTLGIMICLLMVLLGIPITYLSTKMFLQKHDALPA